MTDTLKGILIDPFTQTIEVRTVTRDYRDIYKQIDCSCFTCVYLTKGDAIFVDDEFLFRENQAFWKIGNVDLANKGFVLGSDDEGESQSCKITVDELKKLVVFRPHAEIVGWTKGEEKEHKTGFLGEDKPFVEIIAPRPKLGPKDE